MTTMRTMRMRSCERKGGSVTSRRSLLNVCWMVVAAMQGGVQRSCAAGGSRSGGAGELAAPLPASAGGLTGRPMREEERGLRNSAPPSRHQFPPLLKKKKRWVR